MSRLSPSVPTAALAAPAAPDLPGDELRPMEERLLLIGGRSVVVRPTASCDAGRIAALIAGLSPESRALRFGAARRGLSDAEAEAMAAPPGPGGCGLIALAGGQCEQAVALARYERAPGASEAELAVAVDDRWQGLGLGTGLIERLLARAGADGLDALWATVLPRNRKMRTVFRDLGADARVTTSPDEVLVRLPARADEGLEEAEIKRPPPMPQGALRSWGTPPCPRAPASTSAWTRPTPADGVERATAFLASGERGLPRRLAPCARGPVQPASRKRSRPQDPRRAAPDGQHSAAPVGASAQGLTGADPWPSRAGRLGPGTRRAAPLGRHDREPLVDRRPAPPGGGAHAARDLRRRAEPGARSEPPAGQHPRPPARVARTAHAPTPRRRADRELVDVHALIRPPRARFPRGRHRPGRARAMRRLAVPEGMAGRKAVEVMRPDRVMALVVERRRPAALQRCGCRSVGAHRARAGAASASRGR
jgi:GNAT superfamily N-acetyltransferase